MTTPTERLGDCFGLTYWASVSRQEKKDVTGGLVYRNTRPGSGFREIKLNRELPPIGMPGSTYGGRPISTGAHVIIYHLLCEGRSIQACQAPSWRGSHQRNSSPVSRI